MSSDCGESGQGALPPDKMNLTEQALTKVIAQGAESLPQATSSIEDAQPEGIVSTMLL